MKPSNVIAGVVLLALLCSAELRADIAPLPVLADKPPGKHPVPFNFTQNLNSDISYLQISKADLVDSGIKLQDDGAISSDSQRPGAWSPSTQRSMIAALTLCLSITGILLLKKRRTAAVVAALAAAVMVGALGAQTFAAMSAERKQPEPLKRRPANQGLLWGLYTVINVVDDDKGVILVVGKKPPPQDPNRRPPGPPMPIYTAVPAAIPRPTATATEKKP